jgi:hypothetical protein
MSVLRLIPKVRHTAAFVAPPSSAATTAAIFSALIATGRPPRRPRRRAGDGGALACRATMRRHLIEVVLVLAIFVREADLNAAARQCFAKKYLDFGIDAP